MEEKQAYEEPSDSLNHDKESDKRWSRLKDLLFGGEMNYVYGAIESTNIDICKVDKSLQSEIEEIRGLLSNSIRFEVELLSQDIVNRDIQTQEKLALIDVDVIYIADTFGSYYPTQIAKLAKKYTAVASKVNKQIGIHAHNNIQLAFANTIESKNNGVTFLDVTISGLGRGAGNCAMELLIGYLNNPKYKLTPVLDFIEKFIVPLEKELDWGYSIPYMIAGQLVQHPRNAMKARDEKDTKYLNFYEKSLEEK